MKRCFLALSAKFQELMLVWIVERDRLSGKAVD